MDGLLVHGVMRMMGAVDAAAKGLGYRLYVIKEEAVPLAGRIAHSGFFPATVAVMTVMLLGAAAGLYISACRHYRLRIAELTGRKPGAADWKLWRLKEKAQTIEYELTGENT